MLLVEIVGPFPSRSYFNRVLIGFIIIKTEFVYFSPIKHACSPGGKDQCSEKPHISKMYLKNEVFCVALFCFDQKMSRKITFESPHSYHIILSSLVPLNWPMPATAAASGHDLAGRSPSSTLLIPSPVVLFLLHNRYVLFPVICNQIEITSDYISQTQRKLSLPNSLHCSWMASQTNSLLIFSSTTVIMGAIRCISKICDVQKAPGWFKKYFSWFGTY